MMKLRKKIKFSSMLLMSSQMIMPFSSRLIRQRIDSRKERSFTRSMSQEQLKEKKNWISFSPKLTKGQKPIKLMIQGCLISAIWQKKWDSQSEKSISSSGIVHPRKSPTIIVSSFVPRTIRPSRMKWWENWGKKQWTSRKLRK